MVLPFLYGGNMNNNIEYLLKYISNETFQKIKQKKSTYVLEELHDNYRDVDLNIKYLIKYGITNIDHVIYEMLEDLVSHHNDFIKKIEKYEQTLSKNEVIRMLENI